MASESIAHCLVLYTAALTCIFIACVAGRIRVPGSTFLAVDFKLTCTHSSRSSAAKTIQHFDALIPPATQANTYMTYHICVCI